MVIEKKKRFKKKSECDEIHFFVKKNPDFI